MGSVKYTPASVARAFGGAITFSSKSAAAAADELNKLDNLGDMEPDHAAAEVQAAVSRAVFGEPNPGRAVVSKDQSLAALSTMHAELAFAGVQVGGEGPVAAPQPAPGTEQGGTASAAGGVSQGPGTAAAADAAPASTRARGKGGKFAKSNG